MSRVLLPDKELATYICPTLLSSTTTDQAGVISFSFFNTDVAHTDKVLEAFKGVQFNNRKVDIEISKDRGGKRTRGRGRGKSDGRNKRNSGKKGKFNSEERPKFKGKNRRRDNRPNTGGTGGRRRRR